MKFIASPNFNLRPSHRSIKCIVLHHTGGTFQSAITWFQTPDSKVSAHYVVSRKGEIVQMVDEAKRAWHAGGSSWLGEEDINSISIGIEMEGDGVKPFTKEQIAATLELCKDIRKRRAITDEWVVLHKEIAPERKTDPSPFDKAAFISELNK